MPAVPAINVWPALAIVIAIAAAIGVVFGLMDARFTRRAESGGSVHDLPAAPEEPGEVRRSA